MTLIRTGINAKENFFGQKHKIQIPDTRTAGEIVALETILRLEMRTVYFQVKKRKKGGKKHTVVNTFPWQIQISLDKSVVIEIDYYEQRIIASFVDAMRMRVCCFYDEFYTILKRNNSLELLYSFSSH